MSVTPYLQVTDAKKAIDFYAEAFGAVEQFRLPAEDGKKIMHAVLAIAGGTIFLSDMAPPTKPASVSVALGLENAQPSTPWPPGWPRPAPPSTSDPRTCSGATASRSSRTRSGTAGC